MGIQLLSNRTFLYITFSVIILFVLIMSMDMSENENFRCDNDTHETQDTNYKSLPKCNKLNPSYIPKLTYDKWAMREYLKAINYPIAKGFFVERGYIPSRFVLSEKIRYNKMKFPVIIKPNKDAGGNGIVSGITNILQLYNAIKSTKYGRNGMIVEEQLNGTVYRILYVNKKLVSIISRSPPYVTGNGVDSLNVLIDGYNQSLEKTKTYSPSINYELLRSQNYKLNDIVPDGRRVIINNILNYRGGAITEKYPLDKIHPENRQLFESLLGPQFDSNCLGVDFISPDLSVPYYENNGAILEFNSNPARMLHDIFDPEFKERYLKIYRNK